MRAALLPSAVLSVALLTAPALAWQRVPAPERPADPPPAVDVRGPVEPGAVLVLYDVRDLVTSAPADPRGAAASASSGYVRLGAADGGLADTPGGVAGLAHLVQTYLVPSLDERPAQVLATEDGQLMVLAVQEQQDWVAAFLDLQRQADRQFLIESTLWSVPPGALTDLFDAGGEGALVSTALAPEDLEALVQEVDGQRVTAPRLLVLPRQRASVMVANQRSFVVDWSVVRVEPDQRPVADPHIEVVDEGVAVEARVVALPGGLLGMEVAFTTADIEEPVPVETVSLDEDLPELEVSRVSQRSTSFRTQLVLADGPVALLAPEGAGDQDVIISLVVAPVQAAALAEPAEPTEPDEEPEEEREPGALRRR